MEIKPDTKDWTWVLERKCPECGFDAPALARYDIGARTRDVAARWPAVLARPDATERPGPDVWSPLEYGAHVRDVMRVMDERLQLLLTEDDPTFPNWDQDRTAVEDDYASQNPATVSDELLDAGRTIADRFDTVEEDAWSRSGTRSNGSVFTVDTLGRYFLHDVVHHLHDVRG